MTLIPKKASRGPLDRDSNRTRRRVWANMKIYTRHVIIQDRLNWNDVIKILVGCKALQTIKYNPKLPAQTSLSANKIYKYEFLGRSRTGRS